MSGNQRAPQDKVCSYEYTVKRGDSFYLIAHRLGVPLRDLLEANSDINPARLMVGDILCIPMEEDDAVQEIAHESEAPAESTPVPTQETHQSGTTDAQMDATNSTTNTEAPSADSSADAPEDLLDHPAVLESAETTVVEERVVEAVPQTATQPSQAQTVPQSTVAACPDCPDGDCYTVAAGETIIDIEHATDRTLYTLQMANPTMDLDTIGAGDRLCIPKENAPCPTVKGYIMGADETLESVALKLDVSVGALLRANPCLAPSAFVEGTVICLPLA